MSEAAEIEAQAAAWIARCDARGAEDPELAAWLIADPRHRAAYLRLARGWERTECLARLRPADRAIDPDLLAPRHARAARSRPIRPVTLLGGLAAVLALLAWALLPASATQTYRTGSGGLARVFLSDGSAVTLNANTELRVHYTARRRSLTLLYGEAHFSVTHDTHRPFEVHARQRIVVAVGTAFDVHIEPYGAVDVTVTQGRVALLEERAAHARIGEFPLRTVSAGHDALLTTKAIAVERIDSTEISRRLAWEYRELSFDGQTLSRAVAEFDRYTNRKVVIDDPSIGSLQIGGSFRALDVDSFVAALGRAFGISSRVSTHGTIHLYRVGNVTPARLQR